MMGMPAWFHLKSLGKACHSTCSITSVVWLCFNTAAYGQSTAVNAELPRDLSPWGMYLAADWVVKSVMIGLLFASIVTWTIWLAKAIELVLARRRLRRALQSLSSIRTLGDAAHELGKTTSPADNFVRAAMLELQMTGERHEPRWRQVADRFAPGSDRGCTRPGDHPRYWRARDHWRDGAVCRLVRHGLGHHEQLHRNLEGTDDQSGRGRARHCRGACWQLHSGWPPRFRR